MNIRRLSVLWNAKDIKSAHKLISGDQFFVAETDTSGMLAPQAAASAVGLTPMRGCLTGNVQKGSRNQGRRCGLHTLSFAVFQVQATVKIGGCRHMPPPSPVRSCGVSPVFSTRKWGLFQSSFSSDFTSQLLDLIMVFVCKPKKASCSLPAYSTTIRFQMHSNIE